MKTLTLALAALLLAGCEAPEEEQTAPPAPSSSLEELFVPLRASEPDLVCLPVMNRMHWNGCPMVLV